MILLFSISSGVVLFVIGYHIGNQVGSTSHIRERLKAARDSQKTLNLSR